jgi:hypothetical protein
MPARPGPVTRDISGKGKYVVDVLTQESCCCSVGIYTEARVYEPIRAGVSLAFSRIFAKTINDMGTQGGGLWLWMRTFEAEKLLWTRDRLCGHMGLRVKTAPALFLFIYLYKPAL